MAYEIITVYRSPKDRDYVSIFARKLKDRHHERCVYISDLEIKFPRIVGLMVEVQVDENMIWVPLGSVKEQNRDVVILNADQLGSRFLAIQKEIAATTTALTPQIQLSNERKENTTPPMSTSSGSRLLNLDDLTPVRYRNVMAAINREFAAIAAPDNAQDLTELVNVLYRQEYLFKHKLGEQEVVFIIPPQTLQVCTASIEEFSGLMIRPAYADLAMKLLSSKDNACIKGTPGIGKSMFALYLIHLFVTDTSLQNASSPWKDCIHLVYDYGQSQVFHFTRGSQHFTKEDRNKFADREYNSSTLIHLADGFAFDSSCHRLRGRLIYISSPNLFSQSRINKNMILLSYFMPVWSLQEIEQCNEILHLVEDKETLNKLYNNFGGCPRFVLYYASHRNSATLLQELDKKINENDPQQVIDYIVDHKYTKDVSSSLVHYVVSLDFENITYTFASNYIKSRVISALERGSKRKLVRFLRSSAGISLYQKLRGNLFESLAHDYIACHKEPSRVLKLEPFKDKVEIKIDRPTRTHKFTNDTSELSKFIQDEQNVESVYFKPTDESHGTVDAFSLPNVFYQMTVSKSHSLTITENFVRIIDVMKQHDPDFQTCIFVWVLPDDVFEQFKPPKEITYSFEVTDEQKKYYGRMIKQFKMQIRLTDDLWEQLSSSTISSQNKEE